MSSFLFRSTRPTVLAVLTALSGLACSAGNEDTASTLSAGPYMPGPNATDDAAASEDDDDDDDAAPDDGLTGDGADASTGGSSHACCEIGTRPGCDDPTIEACVCGLAPTCCAGEWTEACVALAGGDCGDPACPSSEDGTGASSGESTGDAPPTMSCGELSRMQGFVLGACEHNGNGACGGIGTPTIDCDVCCDVCPAGDSCGALASANGWAAAACETPGNPACGGNGTPTCDCTVCCEQ